MTDFQTRLISRMEELNLRPSDLVRKTGINKSSISDYMTGKIQAKQTNLVKLAHALMVNETWLMGFDVPPEPNQNTLKIISDTGLDITGLSDKDIDVVKAIISQLKNKN